MAEEIYIARQDTLMDTKAELTEVNTKIGTTANTGGTATAGTVMGKLNNLTSGAATHAAAWTAARATKIDTMDTNVSSVKTSVGATTDTGGSATAGTLMGKLNALVTSLSTHMGRWTAARATKVDTIDTNVTDIKTSVGTAADTTAATVFGRFKQLNSTIGTANQRPLDEIIGSLNTVIGNLEQWLKKERAALTMIKSVQRGYANIPSSESYTTVTISNVNPNKCMVNITGGGYAGSNPPFPGICYSSSLTATKLSISCTVSLRNSSNGSASCSWEVVEFY